MKQIMLDTNLCLKNCSVMCEGKKFYALEVDGTLTLICAVCGRQQFYVDSSWKPTRLNK